MWNQVRLRRDRGRWRDHINEALSQCDMGICLRPLKPGGKVGPRLERVLFYRGKKEYPGAPCHHEKKKKKKKKAAQKGKLYNPPSRDPPLWGKGVFSPPPFFFAPPMLPPARR